MGAMRVLSFAILVSMPIAQAVACLCFGPVPVCDAVGASAAVFTGTVLAIEEPVLASAGNSPGPRLNRMYVDPASPAPARQMRTVRIRINDVLSGVDARQKEIDVATGRGGGDCGYAFQVAEEYVIYAYKNQEGKLETGTCNRTRPLREAADDVAYFQAMANAPAMSQLRVSIGYPGTPAKKGMTIIAQHEGSRISSSTDAGGHAQFTGLPPGEYTIHAQEDGDLADDPKIQLFAKGCRDVTLVRSLRITGRVSTSAGGPASRVQIDVRSIEGKEGNGTMSDMDGRYELRISQPGRYYIGFSLNRTATRETPYPRWFHPGTADPAQATQIAFTGKPEVRMVDMVLPERQPAREISGLVLRGDGRPMPRSVVSVFDDSGVIVGQGVADGNGQFTVQVFAGISYRLHAVWSGDAVNPAVSAVPMEIQPSGEKLTLRLTLTQPGNSAMDELQKKLRQR